MKRPARRAQLNVAYRQCRKPFEDKVGCGGRMVWTDDALFPFPLFGFTGTCLSCGHTAHTLQILVPDAPSEEPNGYRRYVQDLNAEQQDEYLSMWKKLMEENDAA